MERHCIEFMFLFLWDLFIPPGRDVICILELQVILILLNPFLNFYTRPV